MLTIGTFFKQNNLKYGNKIAVIDRDQTLTYQELNERANRLANAFVKKGYQKGDKIAVLMKNHAAYIEIIGALAKIGVIIVPINYRLLRKDVQYIINHSKCRAVITTGEYESLIRSVIPATPQLDTLLMLGSEGEYPFHQYEPFLQSGSNEEPDVEIHENDPFYFGYTSGTTGKPKAVVISHRSRVLTGIVAATEYKVAEDDVHIVAGPIYHAAPWIFLLMQLIVGGTIIIQETFDPEEFLQLTEKYQATNTFLAPTMFNFIVNLPTDIKQKYNHESMRVLISAGAPLPTQTKNDVLKYFIDADLHEFYGSTESGITLNIKPKDIRQKEACVGLPFPMVECLLLDDQKNPMARGEVGELYIKAPYLLDEYYQNDQANQDAFYGNYFTVGDMARQDDDGYYYIVDRKKDMLISGGVNIYPREIEEFLYTHAGILEVAVIGVPDPVWGEAVKAIVVPKAGVSLTEEEIISYCEGRLASYKKPKSVDFVSVLPRNPSGKILKTDLRAPYWQGQGKRI
ncbi:hypothetical protein BTR23_06285 [Alkalihalophilus pseudofirmus]|nr:hypothetical protein BTR23_06285 [Alkalihalophilus pseudofirmus]